MENFSAPTDPLKIVSKGGFCFSLSQEGAFLMNSWVMPLCWNRLFLGVTQWAITNTNHHRVIIVTGNVIFRMYRVRQTCESKSGLGSAKRPGLPSSSVCDRTGPLQKGTWGRGGQDELPASPSRSGDQVCPQTTLVYICFKAELLTGPPSFYSPCILVRLWLICSPYFWPWKT